MSEAINALLERVRISGGRRILALAGGVVAVVALLLIATWGAGDTWVPVAAGMPLEQVGEVTRTLDEAAIEYRLGAGGLRVEVPETELARARVELAGRGLPGKSAPGFELFDQPAWGMTDFTQRINYRRALEGELERTIGAMDGVESARVHLALQQSSVLRRASRPTEASVVVRMQSGARPVGSLVEGIASLVASSVDELASEHVTVLDHAGRLLSRSVEDETGLGLTNRELELRERVERYLEEKAEALVSQITGAANVRVRVAADLNLDRVDRTVQAVNPNEQLVTSEERTEITPRPDDVGAGSVAYRTDYEASRSVERFTSAYGDVKRLSVAVLVNDAADRDGAAPDLDRLESLVAAAIGLDPGRGDVISVVGVPFEHAPAPQLAPPGGPSPWDLWDTFQRPVLTVLALVLAFILGLKLIRAGAPVVTPATALPPATGDDAEEPELPTARELEGLDKGERLRKQLSAVQAQRMQAVTAGVVERPDLAARVVQAWLKD
ncbi:MAG: flagellar basal-body MS-ring/collar protein FliF [Gemmatimonadota bacterium]